MTTRRSFTGRKTVRRAQAQERTHERSLRSNAQQLAVLDTRPGESKRERARLA